MCEIQGRLSQEDEERSATAEERVIDLREAANKLAASWQPKEQRRAVEESALKNSNADITGHGDPMLRARRRARQLSPESGGGVRGS